MASKRSKKIKRQQQALQPWGRRRSGSTPRAVSQIPPEQAGQMAITTTGEIMQLIRLHYEVEDVEQCRAALAALRCLEYDADRRRWVWLYTAEARTLSFKNPRPVDNVVLGEFVFKGPTEVVLNLRSFDRAIHAMVFFDHYIARSVARLTTATVSNRLLSMAEVAALQSLDQYFDRADVVVRDPATLMQDVTDMVARTPDPHERFTRLEAYMADRAKIPVPALERIPVHYYEDGIRAVEALLRLRTIMAMQHWRGNTHDTYEDVARDLLRQEDIPTGAAGSLFTTRPSEDAPLSTQLGALMRSASSADWFHAWELLRDHLPDGITTFAALERLWHLNVQGCFLNNMFYDLDMALQNAGAEDLQRFVQRAEVARWIYTHFPEEDALNIGNFRGYEAEALWELGHTEQAEALFQELTQLLPTFAWGYIWWGDQYWMSDWSYAYAPNYDRAAAIYRQALAQPGLEDRSDVQDRLEALAAEQAAPETRARIQHLRLPRLQRRQSLYQTS